MKKAKMHTPNLTQENIARIRELFPSCVTEIKDPDAKPDAEVTVKYAIDFDLLKQELSGHIVEGPVERYQLNWPGKREALLAANAPIAKTLRPVREESVNFDTTENLFIEGDNLDALKLLQETYLGKVKMIYIDPPYNTGRNLIYKNDFSDSVDAFLERSEQADEGGNKLVANLETNGRFHSDWLSMIYSRLKIAKNFLARDGVLVCAIDENEQAALSLVIKEIFGEGGYEHACVTVVHNPRGQQGTNISYVHEYAIMVYPADKKKYLADVKKSEVDSRTLRDSGTESDRTDARNCFYPFIVKDGKIVDIGDVPADSVHPASANVKRADGLMEIWPMTDDGDEKKWRYSRQSVPQILNRLEPRMGRNSVQIIFHKDAGTMRSVWVDAKYDASEYGTKLVESLIEGSGFTFPKSLWTVYEAVAVVTAGAKDALIMDFFAGSATTAHAVMQLNADDGGCRQFIMVQYPEPCEPKSKPYKAGFKTIADISKQRIRRAGEEILKRENHKDWNKDIGFRVLKVDSSCMADVYYTPDQTNQSDLTGLVENIKSDRTEEDLLFQVLLDWGVDLTLPIVREKIEKLDVFFVDRDSLAACFAKDGKITERLVEQIAERLPMRVVFRDAGFKSDSVRINVEQIFKQKSPRTEIRTI